MGNTGLRVMASTSAVTSARATRFFSWVCLSPLASRSSRFRTERVTFRKRTLVAIPACCNLRTVRVTTRTPSAKRSASVG